MRAVLTYHSVDPSGSAISISELDFLRHVGWLSSGSVRVLPLSALLTDRDSGDAVALTFDDGYQNFGTFVAPLLEDRGLPASLFVVTDRVGGTNAWGVGNVPGDFPVMPLMDWSGVALAAERGIEIGSHGRTHRGLTSLSIDELQEELSHSAQEVMREVGKAPSAFCYPFGDVGARERREVSAHYTHAVTTEFRPVEQGEDPLLIPRLDAYYFRNEGRLESWGTPTFKRYLRLRRRGRSLRASMLRMMGSGSE